MKKLIEILTNSNLSWIEGVFASTHSFDNMVDAKNGSEIEDDSQKIIFEYKEKIIALYEFPLSSKLSIYSIESEDEYRIKLRPKGKESNACVIDLFFHEGGYESGTFRAFLIDYPSHLSTIFQKMSKEKKLFLD